MSCSLGLLSGLLPHHVQFPGLWQLGLRGKVGFRCCHHCRYYRGTVNQLLFRFVHGLECAHTHPSYQAALPFPRWLQGHTDGCPTHRTSGYSLKVFFTPNAVDVIGPTNVAWKPNRVTLNNPVPRLLHQEPDFPADIGYIVNFEHVSRCALSGCSYQMSRGDWSNSLSTIKILPSGSTLARRTPNRGNV